MPHYDPKVFYVKHYIHKLLIHHLSIGGSKIFQLLLLWRKLEYPEKSTDLSQVTDKLYHTTTILFPTQLWELLYTYHVIKQCTEKETTSLSFFLLTIKHAFITHAIRRYFNKICDKMQ
jgi:hypothetical protein